MQKLQFTTKVSDTGTIQLPEGSSFKNKEVEVIIVSRTSEKRSHKANKFIQKWAGFLAPIEGDDSKYAYLIEKHK